MLLPNPSLFLFALRSSAALLLRFPAAICGPTARPVSFCLVCCSFSGDAFACSASCARRLRRHPPTGGIPPLLEIRLGLNAPSICSYDCQREGLRSKNRRLFPRRSAYESLSRTCLLDVFMTGAASKRKTSWKLVPPSCLLIFFMK